MNEIKTLQDVHDLAVNLSYMIKTDIPDNVSVRIELGHQDYINIISELNKITAYSDFTAKTISTWFTYQFLEIKFYIVRKNI